MDLSKIIYILYKILKNIDKNTNFYDELKAIYIKYNIILNENKIEVENGDSCIKLLEKIEDLKQFKLENKKIMEDIKNNRAYKQSLNRQASQFENIKNSIVKASKKIKIINNS